MCSRELLCLTHLHRQLIPRPHTQTHTPWENRLLSDAKKYSPPFKKCCGREGGEHSVQKRWAVLETRPPRPGRRSGQVGAVPKPVEALLRVLDQVLHAAVKCDRPHEQVQVVEEFWWDREGRHRDTCSAPGPVTWREPPQAESAPASQESLDWRLLIQTNGIYSARKQGKPTSPGGILLSAVTPLTLNLAWSSVSLYTVLNCVRCWAPGGVWGSWRQIRDGFFFWLWEQSACINCLLFLFCRRRVDFQCCVSFRSTA